MHPPQAYVTANPPPLFPVSRVASRQHPTSLVWEREARERTPLPCSASPHVCRSLTPLKITALESSKEKEKGEEVDLGGSPADQEAPFVVICNVSSAAVRRTSISLQHVAVPYFSSSLLISVPSVVKCPSLKSSP
ncbi:ABC transporter [Musa troglodytarum]|uniref:ABC transporter n=1 Tax=Musa troglodytarum TaxID=320322 RepID=A0A9E7JL02_9LILI|nr:ABC transporter [Musa troglodytarum]